MSKDKISDYSTTANSNTDIGGINVDEGCAPSGINDAIRTLMAQLKTWQSGGQDVYIHPAGTAAAPSITATGDTNTGIFFPAADTVGISTGGTERARVDSSGNLGLGVTPSAWNSIFRTQQIGIGGFVAGRTDLRTQIHMGSNAYYDSVDSRWEYIGTGEASRYYQGAGAHYWETASSTGSGTGNAITFTQAMTLDASGNLGIGETSIGARLHVNSSSTGLIGIFNSTNANGGYLTGQSSGTAIWDLGTAKQTLNVGGSSDVGINTRSGFLAFGTANTERARITSSGYFKASNNGAYANSSAGYHELKQSLTDTNIAVITSSAASPYGPNISFDSASPNNTTNYFLACTDATNQKAVIYSSGTFGSRTSTYGGISDIKVKQDIVDATSQWNDIKELRFRKYRFKDDPTGPLQLGLISQEAEIVSPGLVFETQDTDTDEEGNMIDLGTVTKSVKYSILYMKAVVALQEAMNRIEQLEADVAALKG